MSRMEARTRRTEAQDQALKYMHGYFVDNRLSKCIAPQPTVRWITGPHGRGYDNSADPVDVRATGDVICSFRGDSFADKHLDP